MTKASVNLQDSFLNQVRKDNTEVKIVMVDGSVLTGFVKGFDNFTIILNSINSQHLIYKHAVSQLISRKPLQKSEDKEKKTSEKPSLKETEDPSLFHKSFSHTPLPQMPSPKKSENFNPIDFSGLKK